MSISEALYSTQPSHMTPSKIMPADLRLTLVQTDLVWQNAEHNRALLQQLISPLAGQTDLIILPEMFTSAFVTGAGSVPEQWPGTTLAWLREQATSLGAAITGSIAVMDEGKKFNRLLFVTPEGEWYQYDKRHLFRMLGEDKRYAAGHDKLLLQWRGWRLFPMVCYDLRFPVWCRNTPEAAWDLMICVANWPAPRTDHWSTLLKARAIENLGYVAGVNRVGQDGNNLAYEGASAVYSPNGLTLADRGNQAGLCSCTLSWELLDKWRRDFPAWMDADSFTLQP